MREKETGKWRNILQKNGFFNMPSLIFQVKKAVSNSRGIFQYLVL